MIRLYRLGQRPGQPHLGRRRHRRAGHRLPCRQHRPVGPRPERLPGVGNRLTDDWITRAEAERRYASTSPAPSARPQPCSICSPPGRRPAGGSRQTAARGRPPTNQRPLHQPRAAGTRRGRRPRHRRARAGTALPALRPDRCTVTAARRTPARSAPRGGTSRLPSLAAHLSRQGVGCRWCGRASSQRPTQGASASVRPRAGPVAGQRGARAPRLLRRARQPHGSSQLPHPGDQALARGAGAPQPARINWDRMNRLATRWLPPAKVMHPFPDARLRV